MYRFKSSPFTLMKVETATARRTSPSPSVYFLTLHALILADFKISSTVYQSIPGVTSSITAHHTHPFNINVRRPAQSCLFLDSPALQHTLQLQSQMNAAARMEVMLLTDFYSYHTTSVPLMTGRGKAGSNPSRF